MFEMETMNLFQPWNLIFFAGFVFYVLIRGVYERKSKRNEQARTLIDGTERFLLALVFIGNLLLPMVYLFTPFLSFADYQLPEFLPWTGSSFMILALYIFWRSHYDLGLNWSVSLELRKRHQLVKHGIYRRVRHPMYVAIILFGVGQGLLLNNWLAGWSALVTFSIMYHFRVSREEAMMCECFGDAYRDYMRHTGRLLPLFINKKFDTAQADLNHNK